jgi:tRNA-2-methylthio-N6-dimethylallyladenosine synthase
VPQEVKQQRLERLQTRIRELGNDYMGQLVGKVQTVLVEKPARREGQLAARTHCNRWLNFDGPQSLIGQFAEVRITEALTNSLRGRLVNA